MNMPPYRAGTSQSQDVEQTLSTSPIKWGLSARKVFNSHIHLHHYLTPKEFFQRDKHQKLIKNDAGIKLCRRATCNRVQGVYDNEELFKTYYQNLYTNSITIFKLV